MIDQEPDRAERRFEERGAGLKFRTPREC
jgi:hypothetical protein